MKTLRLRRTRSGFTLIELMIVIAILAILASVLIPSFIRARAMGQLAACKSNLKAIATAIEMYSVDNSGHYPDTLAKLTPNFLKTIPNCPSASSNTYSSSYVYTLNPDTFDFFCEGSNHTSLALMPDFPKWHSDSGLQER